MGLHSFLRSASPGAILMDEVQIESITSYSEHLHCIESAMGQVLYTWIEMSTQCRPVNLKHNWGYIYVHLKFFLDIPLA